MGHKTKSELQLPHYVVEETELRQYVDARAKDEKYERFVKGQLVWLRQDKLLVRGLRPMEGPVFRPAKVKRSFAREDPQGGILLYKEHGRVKEVEVDEPLAATLVAMGRENLNCWPQFDPGLLWDISEQALFHNIRMRFELGYSFLRVCDNILLFLNKEFDTDFIALSTLSDDGSKQMKAKGRRPRKKKGDDPLACQDSLNTLVERCFSRLVDSGGKQSQSIVVNGVEVSGKRDITRFLLLRSIQLAKPPDASWWGKLLSGDLLLQEFGGTGYVRWTELQIFFSNKKKKAATGGWFNRTSKRFTSQGGNGADGSGGILIGAICNAFGLDKSRVTDNAHPLFPVFESLIKDSKLKHANYAYLSERKKKDPHKNNDEVKSWSELTGAMKQIGLEKDQMENIKKLLMGILETGNIDFGRETPEENAKEVLGVRLGDLRNAIRVKTLQVKSERYFKERSPKEQASVRDGLARVLYSLLFDWLIDVVNKEIARIEKVVKSAIALGLEDPDEEDGRDRATSNSKKPGVAKTLRGRLSMARSVNRNKSKGTIGIIGVLETSSLLNKDSTLEDLYQNYRLERFHAFFLQDVTERNNAKLFEEGRVKANIWYPPGNDMVLNLFMGAVQTNYDMTYQSNKGNSGQKRPSVLRLVTSRYQPNRKNSSEPMKLTRKASAVTESVPAGNDGTAGREKLGVLQLIEEEINMPGGDDKGLARRIIRKKKDNEYLTRATTSDFSIKHFGGNVKYHIEGFIDRSKAHSIPKQVLQLLHEKSSNPLIRQVVAFRSDPIQRSGILGKREVETMMELDNSAVDSVAGAEVDEEDTGTSEGAIDVRRAEVNETAKRIFNEANRAITILGRTHVEYVVSISANRKGDRFGRFEAHYLLDQIRESGLSDAVCNRLSNSLRGPGIPSHEFILRYGPLHGNIHVEGSKVQVPTIKAFCEILQENNMLVGQWELSDDFQRVFINLDSRNALEAALRLLVKPTVIYMQRFARRYLARCEYIRRMHSKIKRLMREAIEESKADEITRLLGEAEKWNFKHAVLGIAQERLRRLQREQQVLQALEDACERKNAPNLYKCLQDAKELGMTGNDFPQVAKALQTFASMESTQVSKKDRDDFNEKFDLVALELKIHLNLDVEGLSDTESEEDDEDDDDSEYEWVTDDGEGSMGSEFDVLDEDD